jgi:hypothetical protein
VSLAVALLVSLATALLVSLVAPVLVLLSLPHALSASAVVRARAEAATERVMRTLDPFRWQRR